MSRRDSQIGISVTSPKISGVPRRKRDSLVPNDFPAFRQEQRPSTSSTASDSAPQMLFTQATLVDSACQALPTPTIITSSVTPPATSPTAPKGRRDSTTQCGRKRRDSRAGASPDRTNSRLSRLQRQATAFDESCLPPGGWSRRGSQPAVSPETDGSERQARRDSLSPDSASRCVS